MKHWIKMLFIILLWAGCLALVLSLGIYLMRGGRPMPGIPVIP